MKEHLAIWACRDLPGQDVVAAQRFTVGSSLVFGAVDQKGNVFSSLGSELFDEFVQRGPEFNDYGFDLRSVGCRDGPGTQCFDAVVTTGVHKT
jgi:hypothetical protein